MTICVESLFFCDMKISLFLSAREIDESVRKRKRDNGGPLFFFREETLTYLPQDERRLYLRYCNIRTRRCNSPRTRTGRSSSRRSSLTAVTEGHRLLQQSTAVFHSSAASSGLRLSANAPFSAVIQATTAAGSVYKST